MKSEKAVLWQLFGAIAVGIITGVLVGYRTNVWVGLLVGTALTFCSADWQHVCRMGKQLTERLLSASAQTTWLKIRRVFAITVRTVKEVAPLLGYVAGIYCSLLIGATFVSTHLIRSTQFFGVPRGTDVLFLEAPLSAIAVMLLCAMAGAVGFSIPLSIISEVKKVPFTLFPLFRKGIPTGNRWVQSRISDTMPSGMERVLDVLDQIAGGKNTVLKLCRKDENGRYVDRYRLAGLVSIVIVLAGLPLWFLAFAVGACVVLAFFLIDTILSGLIALATSRNTIAGICTATGIGVWFFLYPEPPSTFFEWSRLVCFALVGGVIGVGLHELRKYLLSIPLSDQETGMEKVGT
ncbi:MAG: hypothetical protein Q7R64_01365 [bacterium]|nr:hypothetical protein [bacterium]